MNFRSVLGTALRVSTDSRYRNFYLQRMVRDIPKRERKAEKIAAALPRPESFEGAGFSEQTQQLENSGYVVLPHFLSASQILEMRAYFAREKCHDPYRPQLGSFFAPNGVPRETHVAHFTHAQVANAPHALEVANDPNVLALVGKFLNAKPTIGCLRAWWSTPTANGEAEHAEKFHRDVDDWRFVKLFVYLTDVDSTAGPHIFVERSHRLNVLTNVRRYEDREIEEAFGRDKLVQLNGPAGTSFLEYTFGHHRGLPPTEKPRLVYQVLYTLRPVIFGPSEPVLANCPKDPGRSFDAYVNRIYCAAAS